MKYGTQLANGTWIGMVGQVQRHVCESITHSELSSSKRIPCFTVTSSFVILYIRSNESNNTNAYLKLFSAATAYATIY